MKYEYRCGSCKKSLIVDKPVRDSSKTEFCDCKVNEPLIRVYSSSGIKTGDGFKSAK